MKRPSWTDCLTGGANIFVIHHWDTDGISSAALLTEYLAALGDFHFTYIIPEIGTYRLLTEPDTEKGDLSNIDLPQVDCSLCFILDYSVPSRDMLALKEMLGVPLVVYDHHQRPAEEDSGIFYCNPVSGGEPGSDWPSCTWVMRKFLMEEITDIVILGIAGDMEGRFLPCGFERFEEVGKFLNFDARKYNEYVNAKGLVDIHYKENNREVLRTLAGEILSMKGKPELILSRADWASVYKNHLDEIRKFMELSPVIRIDDKLSVYEINTPKNIISAVTRKYSCQAESGYVMVINRKFRENKTQIYVRRPDRINNIDTQIFKDAAESLGAQVGGKEDVAGIIIDDGLVEKYLQKVEERLK
jgi:single-stranded DNA-specific DHH superfamily exonuclease